MNSDLWGPDTWTRGLDCLQLRLDSVTSCFPHNPVLCRQARQHRSPGGGAYPEVGVPMVSRRQVVVRHGRGAAGPTD